MTNLNKHFFKLKKRMTIYLRALRFRLWVWPIVFLKQCFEFLILRDQTSWELLKIIFKKLFFNTYKLPKEPVYEIIKNRHLKDGILDFGSFSLPEKSISSVMMKTALVSELVDICLYEDDFWKRYKWGLLRFFYKEGEYETPEVKLSPGDIVIDAGANFGLFSAVAGAKGAISYAFEPIPENMAVLKKMKLQKGKLVPIELALSDGKKNLKFSCAAAGSSYVMDVPTDKYTMIEATSLDLWVEENNIKRIDFLKADIEGAERDLLKGAQNVLKEMAPKLAICTYHLPDDKEILTKIILEANPKYKLSYTDYKMFGYVEK